MTGGTGRPDSPHQGQPVLGAGQPLASARAAVLLVHGRGATADGMLALAAQLGVRDAAYLAPQAAGYEWYPRAFLEPIETNEPWLTSALALLAEVVDEVEATGPGAERLVLLGFSQGACLALEFVARNPRRYGGAVGWSGGLIGPPGGLPAYSGSLRGTPVLLGCSDRDPHIPLSRVRETEDVLRGLGADVSATIYEGMGHEVNEDELTAARSLVLAVAAG